MELRVPIVQAPMAGGPSTPALAIAVSGAGGLGFLAAGYRSVADLEREMAEVRTAAGRAFGVNVFMPPAAPADPEEVAAYARRLEPLAAELGAELGEPRFDDDEFDAKVDLLQGEPPAVVSFTFGCPDPELVGGLREAGAEVWVTVTGPEEARLAREAGADALVAQGVEAGGHRGCFADREGRVDYGLMALLALLRAEADLPLVASGGLMSGEGVAAALVAGATAAQLGTAFMLCPEAGTSPAHREAIRSSRPTGLTRAFSGRLARGIVNRMQEEHTEVAPLAYPEVHHLTSPLRAEARRRGEGDAFNLWAGEGHSLADERPAAELVGALHRAAREARGEPPPRGA